jgi:hypothetical protein
MFLCTIVLLQRLIELKKYNKQNYAIQVKIIKFYGHIIIINLIFFLIFENSLKL